MGSVMMICMYGESRREIDEAMNHAVREFTRVDRLLSVFHEESFVSAVNRAAGREMVPADPDIVELFASAKKFSESTDGAFDITVEPLMRTWGFRNGKRELKRVPTDRELLEMLSAVGHENILVDRKNGFVGLRHPRAAVDLGGIAVGWTIDRAVGILREHGITAAFINHAGDAYALGIPEESDGWVVGIPHPDHPEEIMYRMELHDEAVATSGNYQNFVQVGDERFGHLIDPRSGRPDSDMLSITVVAKTALEADALSTGLYCSGLHESAPVFEQPLRAICVERKNNRPVLREVMKREKRKKDEL
jgi:thiamine biosynthesis lipoprotein